MLIILNAEFMIFKYKPSMWYVLIKSLAFGPTQILGQFIQSASHNTWNFMTFNVKFIILNEKSMHDFDCKPDCRPAAWYATTRCQPTAAPLRIFHLKPYMNYALKVDCALKMTDFPGQHSLCAPGNKIKLWRGGWYVWGRDYLPAPAIAAALPAPHAD